MRMTGGTLIRLTPAKLSYCYNICSFEWSYKNRTRLNIYCGMIMNISCLSITWLLIMWVLKFVDHAPCLGSLSSVSLSITPKRASGVLEPGPTSTTNYSSGVFQHIGLNSNRRRGTNFEISSVENNTFNRNFMISNGMRIPPEFKHITKGRKRK